MTSNSWTFSCVQWLRQFRLTLETSAAGLVCQTRLLRSWLLCIVGTLTVVEIMYSDDTADRQDQRWTWVGSIHGFGWVGWRKMNPRPPLGEIFTVNSSEASTLNDRRNVTGLWEMSALSAVQSSMRVMWLTRTQWSNVSNAAEMSSRSRTAVWHHATAQTTLHCTHQPLQYLGLTVVKFCRNGAERRTGTCNWRCTTSNWCSGTWKVRSCTLNEKVLNQTN